MKEFGPKGKSSASNYISWLNFISEQGFEVNTNLKSNQEIISKLKSKENTRSIYKSKDAYSDFGSALNKYRKFIVADYLPILSDLESIEYEIISETEKEELRKARIGQGKYRKALISLWKKCSVTQFHKTELLIASHILPWHKSTNIQRLDKFNGLLLLPNYDKLFDKGLISFEDNGKIIVSYKILETEQSILGINKNDKLFNVNKENIKYLKQHREIYNETLYKK
jgi:predicted restriction endonuclease